MYTGETEYTPPSCFRCCISLLLLLASLLPHINHPYYYDATTTTTTISTTTTTSATYNPTHEPYSSYQHHLYFLSHYH